MRRENGAYSAFKYVVSFPLSLRLVRAVDKITSLIAVDTQERATKATTTTAATTRTWVRRIWILQPAIRRPGRRILNIIRSSRINTKRNPGHDPVAQRLSKLNIPYNRIDRSSLVREHHVFRVRHNGVGVRRVRINQISIVNEVLVEKDLPDVVDGASVPQQCAVGQLRGVLVDDDVGVCGSRSVVSWERELDLDNTFIVGWPDGAGEGRVENAWVCSVAIVGVVGAGVGTGLVGLPEFGPLVGYGLASVDVDDLDVQGHVDAL